VGSGPKIFIPMAAEGRPTLREGLNKLGCNVTWNALYRTLPKQDLNDLISSEDLKSVDLLIFTSPSSIESFRHQMDWPPTCKVGAIGKYTAEHLQRCGITSPPILPEGNFAKIGDLLC
jgi:uroporphyrinogen-III synthase